MTNQIEIKDNYRSFLPYCEYRFVDSLLNEINRETVNHINKFEILSSKMNFTREKISDELIAEIRNLRFRENKTHEEISNILGLAKSSVHKYVNAIAYK